MPIARPVTTLSKLYTTKKPINHTKIQPKDLFIHKNIFKKYFHKASKSMNV